MTEHFVNILFIISGLTATEVDGDGTRGQAVSTEVTIIVSVSHILVAFEYFLSTNNVRCSMCVMIMNGCPHLLSITQVCRQHLLKACVTHFLLVFLYLQSLQCKITVIIKRNSWISFITQLFHPPFIPMSGGTANEHVLQKKRKHFGQ